nr:hypothetical protein [Tanacetum cinerariifolium]
TNVVNAPREPFVVKQDHGVNPPHIDGCCCECGDALDGIFCQHCTCKSCGKGAHIGYNYPPKVSIISNSEPCNQTMNNELPQTLSGFDPTCYFDKENSVPCVSKPNFVDESSNIFNPPPQPPIYSYEFCWSNAQYGHYCTPQVPFINPEPGYNQDFNFPQDIHDFQQQYLCCDHDDDSLYNENIEYVEGSPHDSELVSLEVAEIVILKDEEIEDDNLREKLLNETNTFHNSLPEFENFCFDLEEISSGSTTTHSDISLPDYEVFYFYDDHIEEISSGSTITHSDIYLSEYDSFIFDLSNDQFPPTDRSDLTHEEFAGELAHIISPPKYDRFYFRNLPDQGELISILNSGIRENLSTTCVNLPVEDDHFPLLAYVVWIFLAYLTSSKNRSQFKIVLKWSRQETHISQQSGSGTGEGTGSKPGVPDVPSDDSEEELSWKSSDDEEVGSHEEGEESDDDSDEGSDKDSDETVKYGAGKDGDEDDDDDDNDDDEEEETAKDDEEDKETGKDGDEVRKSGDSKKESDDEEEQESRLSEEARIQKEEDAEELYRDVNINQGRGLQVNQSVEDTHVILTPVNPDDPQESSSMIDPKFLKTLVFGVLSRFTQAS